MPSSYTGKSRSKQQSGNTERAITIASGALLLAPVLRKRTILNWSAAAAGGALIYDGVSGTCAVSHKLGFSPESSTKQQLQQLITIGKDASELYKLWRNPDTMARLVRPWAEIETSGVNHIRWSIPLPVGPALRGEAIMVEARENELVHWTTMPDDGLQIDEWFELTPAPQGRGTEVKLKYLIDFSRIRGGRTVRAISSFFEKAPRIVIGKLLHNFKALAETGEIPTLERNSSARTQNETQAHNHWRGDLI